MPVSDQLEQQLQRWIDAGVVDPQTVVRIRAFESSRESPGLRWPVVLAIAFGAIMVAAGALLFVAAHWEDLSPAQRFLLVLTMIAAFHLTAGALISHMRALGIALHGVGTVALGGGIFLAAQVFNLQEHWPAGILLWALGAALSFLVLRDWVQASLAALLIPAWIAAEWSFRAQYYRRVETTMIQFLTMVAITYLSARRSPQDSYFRRALGWAGGLALLPLGVLLALTYDWETFQSVPMPALLYSAGLMLALLLPLFAAFVLRGKSLIWNAGYMLWVLAVPFFNRGKSEQITMYGMYALASIGLAAWGVQERRRERIDLGVAAFALTIIVFYFSNVMDKLGRSASLIGFGILFLLGGWKLEQLRRKLVARTAVKT